MNRALARVLLAACGLATSSLALAPLSAAVRLSVDQAAPIAAINPASIYLQSAEIDTAQPGQGGDRNALVKRIAQGDLAGRHFIVKLDGPMRPEWRTRLAAAGIVLGDYLPVNAFIVTLDHADSKRVQALDFVRWYSEYRPEWKLAPGIGARAYVTQERRDLAAAGQVVVVVNLFRGVASPAVVRAISDRPGAQVHWVQDIGGNQTISATMNLGDVAGLSLLPDVQWIEEAPDVDVRNDTNRWIVQSNQPSFTPLYTAGLRGEGQILGLLDTRLDRNHCSFSDPSQPVGPLHRKILAYNTSTGAAFHGTHVAGTAVGDAGNSTSSRGIAYLGKVVFNIIPSFTETAMVASCNTHHTQGARVHTNSWGDDGTTQYNSLCRGVDVFSYNNEDDLILFAVTNTGSLKNPENAKNLLAVGATQDNPSQGSHCSGGAGPTSDGRRKPEIYAPGCNTNSADSGTACGLTTATGTSMACPAVAASAMLVRQYYMDGFYPSGMPTPSDAFTPSAALVKATLLNSAVDMAGPAGYPSNQEGWGRVLLDNSLYLAADTRQMWTRDVRNADGLTTSQQVEYPLSVLNSGQRLNITLVWTEPAATSGASFAAVNDLDLEVIAPGGTLYKGNVFTSGQSSAGGNRDDRNNVEQVQLAAPTAGAWTVRVKGSAVNVGSQGYAIVVSGDIPSSAGVTISVDTLVPAAVLPSVDLPISVTISAGSDTIVPGSQLLHYRLDSGAFQVVPLTPDAGTRYTASIPGAACAERPQFYVSVEGVNTGLVTAPPGGAASPFSYAIGTATVVENDDFETDQGWISTWPDDTSSIGRWVRVDPVGSIAAPADDHTPGAGTNCWITSQEFPFGGGPADVDAGATSLVSPTFDLSTAQSAVVSYYRWYNTNTGVNPNSDTFLVQASSDNGATWTTIETVGPGGADAMGGWIFHQEELASRISLTSQVRVRFVAQDLDADSTVEAGIDDFRLDAIECDAGDACACDWNDSGVLNSQDFFDFLAGFFAENADFNNDNVTNSQDFFDFLGCFFAGC